MEIFSGKGSSTAGLHVYAARASIIPMRPICRIRVAEITSLANLRAGLAEVQEACTGGNLEEASESVAFVLRDPDSLLENYIRALGAHGMQLPFCRTS